MDNNIENNNVQNNNGTAKKGIQPLTACIILIIVVAITVVISYMVFGKNNNEDVTNTDNNINENTGVNDEMVNGSKIDVDFTYITELHDSLIVDDEAGMYLKNKISIDEYNNEELIRYGLAKYIQDKNIKLVHDENNLYDEMGAYVLAEISKTEFNNYMHEKFNTDVNYDLTLTAELNDGSYYYLTNNNSFISDKDKWTIVYPPAGGNSPHFEKKLENYEAYENYIYIYDKAVYCWSSAGALGCHSLINHEIDFDVIDCSQDEDGNTISSCPLDEEYPSLEELSEYAFNNLSDKLNTFKHTFKKGTDGKYYWYSSEMVK